MAVAAALEELAITHHKCHLRVRVETGAAVLVDLAQIVVLVMERQAQQTQAVAVAVVLTMVELQQLLVAQAVLAL